MCTQTVRLCVGGGIDLAAATGCCCEASALQPSGNYSYISISLVLSSINLYISLTIHTHVLVQVTILCYIMLASGFFFFLFYSSCHIRFSFFPDFVFPYVLCPFSTMIHVVSTFCEREWVVIYYVLTHFSNSNFLSVDPNGRGDIINFKLSSYSSVKWKFKFSSLALIEFAEKLL